MKEPNTELLELRFQQVLQAKFKEHISNMKDKIKLDVEAQAKELAEAAGIPSQSVLGVFEVCFAAGYNQATIDSNSGNNVLDALAAKFRNGEI